jgi:hypothetical protein
MRFYFLLLLAHSVVAFKDTSPFFLLSTAQFPSLPSTNLISSSSLTPAILGSLLSCPSETYILVTQPSVFAADFAAPGAAPNLRRALVNDTGLATAIGVPEVLGDVDMYMVEVELERICGASVVRADVASKSEANSTAVTYFSSWCIAE